MPRRIVAAIQRRPWSRAFVSSTGAHGGTKMEQTLHSLLQTHLEAVHVKVTDVSGGCGSMFDVEVASPQFVGQSRLYQHRMVNKVHNYIKETVHQVTKLLTG